MNKRILLISGGAVVGYLYYVLIGCNSGTCAITSSPLNSTMYGALIGLVWGWPSKKDKEN
ncbi:MAG: hypothetical protein H8E70_00800 [Candidatus Marinimicrobia bacterium]|nr:hypothetical protein [Candidatus Neomarinimicrobiota bacterium]